jgi:hypothetical protein
MIPATSSINSVPMTSVTVSVPSSLSLSSSSSTTTTYSTSVESVPVESVAAYAVQSPTEILSQLSKAGVLPTMSSSQVMSVLSALGADACHLDMEPESAHHTELMTQQQVWMHHSGIRDSCWELFKKLQILPLYSQYMYSLLMFIVINRGFLKLNSDIHNIGTRCNNDFHLPSAQFKLFQKWVFYSGIKMYNTFHWLSSSCHIMSNDLDAFWKDLSNLTPFILLKIISTSAGSEWYCVCCKL